MHMAYAYREFSDNYFANLLNVQKTVQKILIHKNDFT